MTSLAHAEDPSAPLDLGGAGIVTVRPAAETQTLQKLPYFVGISQATAGAKGISMNRVVIPPGGTAEPHFHRDYETAIYLLKGRVETRYGPGLKQSVINEAGDFIFIPPGVPHQPFNLDPHEPAYALVARNDPNEQENVVLYDPTADMK
ncbi:MAG: cupin domain-containing protein [Thermostichus sp. HHBFW_bins_43]